MRLPQWTNPIVRIGSTEDSIVETPASHTDESIPCLDESKSNPAFAGSGDCLIDNSSCKETIS